MAFTDASSSATASTLLTPVQAAPSVSLTWLMEQSEVLAVLVPQGMLHRHHKNMMRGGTDNKTERSADVQQAVGERSCKAAEVRAAKLPV